MISVVVPVYNEEANVAELAERVSAALAGREFELIVVDDGSRDGTAEALAGLAATRAWLKPLYMIRNYGQSAALQAGFDAAKGDVVVTLDGDLQNDPADIPELLKLLQAQPDIDVISGWRKDRQDKTLSRKIPSQIANFIISRVTGVRLHDYGCSLKLYRAQVIRDLKVYGELHRFIPALAADVGAKIVEVPVRHHARLRGESKYGIDRTFRVILDLLWIKFLMRFLHRPLQAFGGVGLALLTLGFLILAWLTYDKLALGHDIGGRPLLLLGALLALIGVQLLATGLLGELLTRIYHEPQGRPQYLLRPGPRPALKTLARIVAGAAVLAAVVWYVDPAVLRKQLFSVDAGIFAFAVLASILANLISATRWCVIARLLGLAAPFGPMVAMYFRGVTMNVLLPGATVSGDLLRSYQLSKKDNPLLRAGLSVLLDRLSGLWMLCALSLLSLLGAKAMGMLGPMSRDSFLIYTALLAFSLVAPWVPFPFVKIIEETRQKALEAGGPLLRSAWLSASVQLASSFALWLCGIAAGVELSYPLMLAAAAPIFIMAAVPLGWAGFGARELSAVVVLGLLGVPADQATACALLYGLAAVVQGALSAPLFLVEN